MDSNDEEPAGRAHERDEDAGDALAPPERDDRLSRNPVMVAVIAVVAAAIIAFVVIAAIG